jgi:hypothetical protein
MRAAGVKQTGRDKSPLLQKNRIVYKGKTIPRITNH